MRCKSQFCNADTDNSVTHEFLFVSGHDIEAESLEGGKYICVAKMLDNFVNC